MLKREYLAVVVLSAGLTTSMVGAGHAQTYDLSGFKPHRAVYDLSLKQSSDRSGIGNITGRIVYELTGSACEGFAARYRFSTRVHVNGKTLLNDQRSTVFESGDGKRFDFITQYFLNGQQEQDLRGSATRDDNGISVSLKKPEEREVDLETALFMNQHLGRLIKAAKAGDTIVTEKVFDGSDNGDQLVDTTAIVGKLKSNVDSLEGEPEKLKTFFSGSSGWPVSVSYYKRGIVEGGGERLPSYQVSFLLHEDGVSRNLTMQYTDYSMKGVLKDIEYLKAEPCK